MSSNYDPTSEKTQQALVPYRPRRRQQDDTRSHRTSSIYGTSHHERRGGDRTGLPSHATTSRRTETSSKPNDHTSRYEARRSDPPAGRYRPSGKRHQQASTQTAHGGDKVQDMVLYREPDPTEQDRDDPDGLTIQPEPSRHKSSKPNSSRPHAPRTQEHSSVAFRQPLFTPEPSAATDVKKFRAYGATASTAQPREFINERGEKVLSVDTSANIANEHVNGQYNRWDEYFKEDGKLGDLYKSQAYSEYSTRDSKHRQYHMRKRSDHGAEVIEHQHTKSSKNGRFTSSVSFKCYTSGTGGNALSMGEDDRAQRHRGLLDTGHGSVGQGMGHMSGTFVEDFDPVALETVFDSMGGLFRALGRR